ncbi:MAG: amidohydrolase family protein [Burkholderiales bacterium]|nr:amidohydrolase family protein [Phycisphaerae bacterium]
MTIIRARHLATMKGPVIEDGCVIVDAGRVVQVGATSVVRPGRIDEEIDGVLMPGLMNRHTHLELTNVPRPTTPPATFQDWIAWLGPAIRGDPESFDARRGDAVRAGIAQCIRFGVTEVWDISQNVEIVRPILASAPIRSTSFGECLGIGERRGRFDVLMRQAMDESLANERMRIGVSPHAPYTVDERGYAMVLQGTAHGGIPVMTHLAETEDEGRFLLDHSGAFGGLYASLGIDAGPAPAFSEGPIAWLRAIGGAASGIIAAHVNYASDEDINHLSAMKAHVVWCPRTHTYFGHPPHRWREMQRAGIKVSIGTDSCASSPDLNIVDDLRLVHEQSRDVPVEEIWSLCAGSLEGGVPGDYVSFPTRSGEPLCEILESPGLLPDGVWVDGARQTP